MIFKRILWLTNSSQMRCFLLNICLIVNCLLACCFGLLTLLRLRILLATISGVSLVYEGFTFIVTALIKQKRKIINVTIFIWSKTIPFGFYNESNSSYKGFIIMKWIIDWRILIEFWIPWILLALIWIISY